MSADLFEAFVGSQGIKADSKELDQKHSSQLLDLSQSEDTWQPWPAATRPTSQWSPEHEPQKLWETDQDGRDILFDAGQADTDPALLDSDDEFGDFEEVSAKQLEKGLPQTKSLSTTIDLLDLDNAENRSGNPTEIVKNQSVQVAPLDKHTRATHKSIQTISKEQITEPVADFDDDWGDFETTQTSSIPENRLHGRNAPTAVSVNQARPQQNRAHIKQQTKILPVSPDARPVVSRSDIQEDEPWDDFEISEADKVVPSNNIVNLSPALDVTQSVLSTEQRSRPTNVPPPAVLLAWLPKIFSRLAAESRQPDADPVCGFAAVQAYRASARIIAGRAARWKRDSILAQSMRIGVAGRSGGMKLAVLDKGESRKEDQAAEDAIASWTQHSHMLNAAIARAKAQRPPMALSVKLSARTATGLDVVSATHVCAACGLRRNERVIGIDASVSDTFGEFWIEHWGHKDCMDTWYAFSELLDKR